MASGNSVSDAEYALSKILQMGVVEDYQREFEMLIKRVKPQNSRRSFSLARATEARFEDQRLSEGDHKDDMYKLVEVVGTTKVDVPYGEIQEKAITFQSVLIDDRLGIEMLRFNQLRDRASENKKKKMVVAIQRRLWDTGIKIVFRQHLEDKVVSEGVGNVMTVKSRITIK
ncbi:hypothetical protein Tco_1288210 [Tanacetum coccineum]